MNQLSRTRASEAPAVGQCDASELPSMPASCSDPESLARTSKPRKKRRFRQAGEGHFPAAPMPSNAEPVSRAAEAVKNRPRPSRYASRIRSPVNEIGPAGIGQRDQQHGEHRRHQADHRPGPEHPGRGRAEDRALPEELDEIVVRLQDRRTDPAGEQGLGLGDDAQQQRRQCQAPGGYGPCCE